MEPPLVADESWIHHSFKDEDEGRTRPIPYEGIRYTIPVDLIIDDIVRRDGIDRERYEFFIRLEEGTICIRYIERGDPERERIIIGDDDGYLRELGPLTELPSLDRESDEDELPLTCRQEEGLESVVGDSI